eukprot:TRINITY_DN1938_c0_g1_i3.p1 TRINITY_DN1938_c0_g1~~TRINITY_DN1938_c0_g1_i3.p1  ORF type:complete len:613 (-),score=165.47 TRINITY_DN1938_c0_g1_i3:873-2711(-)
MSQTLIAVRKPTTARPITTHVPVKAVTKPSQFDDLKTSIERMLMSQTQQKVQKEATTNQLEKTKKQLVQREKDLLRVRKEKSEIVTQLQSEREKYRTMTLDLKATTTMCEAVRNAVENLEQQLAEAEEESKSLKADLEEEFQEKASLSKQVDDAKKSADANLAEFNRELLKSQSLQFELSEARKKHSDDAAAIEDAKQAASEAKGDAETMRLRVQESEKALQYLQHHASHLQNELEKQLALAAQSLENKAAQEKLVNLLQEQVLQLTKQAEDSKKVADLTLENYNQEIQKSQALQVELTASLTQRAVDEAAGVAAKLEAEQAKVEITEKQQQLVLAEHSLKEMEREIASLRNDLDKQLALAAQGVENKMAQDKLTELLQAQLNQLTTQLEDTKKSSEASVAEYNNELKKSQALQLELADARQQQQKGDSQAKADAEQAKTVTTEKQKQLRAAQKALKKAESRAISLKTELDKQLALAAQHIEYKAAHDKATNELQEQVVQLTKQVEDTKKSSDMYLTEYNNELKKSQALHAQLMESKKHAVDENVAVSARLEAEQSKATAIEKQKLLVEAEKALKDVERQAASLKNNLDKQLALAAAQVCHDRRNLIATAER